MVVWRASQFSVCEAAGLERYATITQSSQSPLLGGGQDHGIGLQRVLQARALIMCVLASDVAEVVEVLMGSCVHLCWKWGLGLEDQGGG